MIIHWEQQDLFWVSSGNGTQYHFPLLTDNSQNQTQSTVVPIKPITFTHTGNNHPSIITDTPVIILKRCKTPTIPKIEPATRRPRILEFIMLKYTIYIIGVKYTEGWPNQEFMVIDGIVFLRC
jgi:hypothetical protein